MTELLAAGVGALLGYFFGWLQNTLADRSRRRAVATALLFELQQSAAILAWLENSWNGSRRRIFFHTPMHDRFAEEVERFDATTVGAVLDFSADLNIVKEWVNGGPADRPSLHESYAQGVKRRAKRAGRKAAIAERLLKAAGGRAVPALPGHSATPDHVERLSAGTDEVKS